MIATAECDQISSERWMPPSAPRTMAVFAPTIRLPDGPQTGEPWDPNSEPTQRAWVREWDSGKWSWLLNIASRQRGKTLKGIIAPTLWSVCENRRSVGYIMPNLDKLAQNYEGKIKPGFDGSGYGAWFPNKGPGSRGGRPSAITLRDPASGHVAGRVYFMALGKGSSETSVSSVSPALVVVDEADDAESAGQLANACGRIDAWGTEGRAVIVSTLNQRGDRIGHPCLQFYGEGTRSRWGHTCPVCTIRAPLEFEHINLAEGRVACPSCGVLWTEEQRRQAIVDGDYIHGTEEPTRPRFLSVIEWELDFLRGSLSTVINEYKNACIAKDNGDRSLWTVFINKRLCREDIEGDGEVPNTIDMHLAARAAYDEHTRGTIPKDAAVITIGCDTGKREAWWLSLAMAPDMRWWVVDWSVKTTSDHRAEPSPVEQRTMLDRMHERAVRTGRAVAMGIDVGYNTDLVVPWARAHGYRMVRGDQRPSGKKEEVRQGNLPSWAEDRKQDDGTHWLFIDGAEVKKELHRSFARKVGEAGAGHIPCGQEAGDWLIRHITSEIWNTEHKVWTKKPGRENHLLDCLVYAWALAVINLNRQRVKLPPRKYGNIGNVS